MRISQFDVNNALSKEKAKTGRYHSNLSNYSDAPVSDILNSELGSSPNALKNKIKLSS